MAVRAPPARASGTGTRTPPPYPRLPRLARSFKYSVNARRCARLLLNRRRALLPSIVIDPISRLLVEQATLAALAATCTTLGDEPSGTRVPSYEPVRRPSSPASGRAGDSSPAHAGPSRPRDARPAREPFGTAELLAGVGWLTGSGATRAIGLPACSWPWSSTSRGCGASDDRGRIRRSPPQPRLMKAGRSGPTGDGNGPR